MKRLIIDGDWKRSKDAFGSHWLMQNASGVAIAVVYDLALPTVEDAPLALPTEPGARFWGSFDKTAPCWWFVRTERGTEGVWYVSQHVDRGSHPTGINSTSIAATEGRLVRLPDPEETP